MTAPSRPERPRRDRGGLPAAQITKQRRRFLKGWVVQEIGDVRQPSRGSLSVAGSLRKMRLEIAGRMVGGRC